METVGSALADVVGMWIYPMDIAHLQELRRPTESSSTMSCLEQAWLRSIGLIDSHMLEEIEVKRSSPTEEVLVYERRWCFIGGMALALLRVLPSAAQPEGPNDLLQGPKIYISADLEGVTGVVTEQQLGTGGFEYERFRRFMTAEVLAAIDGARAAGAVIGELIAPLIEYVPVGIGADRKLKTDFKRPRIETMHSGTCGAIGLCRRFHAGHIEDAAGPVQSTIGANHHRIGRVV